MIKMKIRIGKLVIVSLFLASCVERNTDSDRNKQADMILCDTLLPFTINLLKIKGSDTLNKDMAMIQNLNFTCHKYDPKTKENRTLQIPFAESTFNELSGCTKYDNIDLDSIFKNHELQKYTSIPVTTRCINWKVINADTIENWNRLFQTELAKDKHFIMPQEWFRFYTI